MRRTANNTKVVKLLKENVGKPLGASTISKHTNVHGVTVYSILDRLVTMGMVYRDENTYPITYGWIGDTTWEPGGQYPVHQGNVNNLPTVNNLPISSSPVRPENKPAELKPEVMEIVLKAVAKKELPEEVLKGLSRNYERSQTEDFTWDIAKLNAMRIIANSLNYWCDEMEAELKKIT